MNHGASLPRPFVHPGLRDELRAGTRDLHDALDALVRSRGFLHSVESYGDFLRRSYEFQSAAEAALDAAGAERWIPDWAARRRSHRLRDDMLALGVTPPSSTMNDPACTKLLADGAERVLGVAYVLEGSKLGGKMILREIAPLGLDAQRGASFLDEDGVDGAWRSFVRLLERYDSPPFDRTAVLHAARAAFSAAHSCFAAA